MRSVRLLVGLLGLFGSVCGAGAGRGQYPSRPCIGLLASRPAGRTTSSPASWRVALRPSRPAIRDREPHRLWRHDRRQRADQFAADGYTIMFDAPTTRSDVALQESSFVFLRDTVRSPA